MTQAHYYCLEEPAFHALIDEVVQRENTTKPYRWVSGEKAMEMLGISSKTTLQKYRDEDRIRFSHPDKKLLFMIITPGKATGHGFSYDCY